MHAPLCVASYLIAALPKALKGSLPEIEELEATLADTLVSTDEVQVERNEKAEAKEPTGGES
jgi:hypothetical protein